MHVVPLYFNITFSISIRKTELKKYHDEGKRLSPREMLDIFKWVMCRLSCACHLPWWLMERSSNWTLYFTCFTFTVTLLRPTIEELRAGNQTKQTRNRFKVWENHSVGMGVVPRHKTLIFTSPSLTSPFTGFYFRHYRCLKWSWTKIAEPSADGVSPPSWL